MQTHHISANLLASEDWFQPLSKGKKGYVPQEKTTPPTQTEIEIEASRKASENILN